MADHDEQERRLRLRALRMRQMRAAFQRRKSDEYLRRAMEPQDGIVPGSWLYGWEMPFLYADGDRNEVLRPERPAERRAALTIVGG